MKDAADPVPRDGPVPGDGLLHPVALVAVATLIGNDHWGKAAFPGGVTGKLSDVAGMVFFPLFLQALWEVGLAAAGRRGRPSRRALWLAAGATAFTFAAVKLWPPAGELYRHVLGLFQWPPRAALALVSGRHLPGVVPVSLVRDATDLLALPAVVLGVLLGLPRTQRRDERPVAGKGLRNASPPRYAEEAL